MRRTPLSLRPLLLLALLWFAVPLGAADVRAADLGPRFTVHSVPVDGGAVSVAVGGSGPAVILLHGYAEALVKGRERTFFEHFWNDFAADKTRSIPEADRRAYTNAYSRPGRMAAGFAYFASFPKTATEFADLAKTKLAIPVLALGGEKSLGEALGAQTRLVASDVSVIVLKNTGHWLLEEQPAETIAALSRFLN
jgi:hypothetical protein